MASSYSTDLSLELVATGEKAGLWGTITNTNLQLLQQAVSGYVEVTLNTGTTTLLLSDGSATANGSQETVVSDTLKRGVPMGTFFCEEITVEAMCVGRMYLHDAENCPSMSWAHISTAGDPTRIILIFGCRGQGHI